MQTIAETGPCHGRSLLSLGVGAVASALLGAALLLYVFVGPGGNVSMFLGFTGVGVGLLLATLELVLVRYGRSHANDHTAEGGEVEHVAVASACSMLALFVVLVLLAVVGWYLFQLSKLA
jgi:hypothetical protein